MLVDHLLDRHRAGHGRLLAHEGGARAEGEAGQVPERLQGRRPHPSLGDQVLEGLEVTGLLGVHLGDRRAAGRPPEDRELALVDAPGSPPASPPDST